MSIDAYLNQYSHKKQITLIGPFCRNLQEKPEPVIFVDSGTHFRKSNEGISVGDGDSFDGKIDVSLNPDKDFSDLAFALDNIPQNFSEINLIGFLGGRRDHEMFNIGEAHHFLKSRESPTSLFFDDKIYGYSAGQWRFERQGSFSIAVIEATSLTLTGDCMYQCVEKTTFNPLCSLGLSNIGQGTILLNCDDPAFVLFEEL